MSLDDLENQAEQARKKLAESLEEVTDALSKEGIKRQATSSLREFFFDEAGNLRIQRVIATGASIVVSFFVLFSRGKGK
jgi:ribosome-binding ATPase YchF (GTP1/OBG family)